MSEEEIRKAAQHLLDNFDELIAPDIPKMVEDIKDIISLNQSGKYTQEELKQIAKEKADKLANRGEDNE